MRDDLIIHCRRPYQMREEREAGMRYERTKFPGRLKPRHQRALDYLRAEKRVVNSIEMAAHLKCSRSTAHTIARALVRLGLAEMVPGKQGGAKAVPS